MENTIRNVLFFIALGVLIVYFIPGRPSMIDILGNLGPAVLPAIIIILFVAKVKKFSKTGSPNWQKNIISELNKLSSQSSSNKKPRSNVLKEFDKFINRSDKS
jgi:hypothetical protein